MPPSCQQTSHAISNSNGGCEAGAACDAPPVEVPVMRDSGEVLSAARPSESAAAAVRVSAGAGATGPLVPTPDWVAMNASGRDGIEPTGCARGWGDRFAMGRIMHAATPE